MGGKHTTYTVIKGVCSSSRLVLMLMDPSMDILGTQNAPTFWPLLTDFET